MISSVKYYYFYIIRSLEYGKLYLGYTPKDPFSRLKEHNQGKVKATKPYVPYEIIFFSGFRNKEDALACEKYYKTTAGWRRIKRMLGSTLREEIGVS